MAEERSQEEVGLLPKYIVFILLNLAFFLILFLLVMRISTGDAAYEKFYAKQVALLIDSAKKNTEIKLDASDLVYRARKNKYKPSVEIKDNGVNVKVIEGEGYSYKYYSDNKINYALDVQNGKLLLHIS